MLKLPCKIYAGEYKIDEEAHRPDSKLRFVKGPLASARTEQRFLSLKWLPSEQLYIMYAY